ncbi:MAG: hypothetical protein FJ303_19325 [Planctomycetes bacterium]|nr:hypothetical protein [Planctomycetota bacterium]
MALRVFILSNDDLTSNIIFSSLLDVPEIEICGVAYTATLTGKKGGAAGALAILEKTDWRYWLFLVFINGFFKIFDVLSTFSARWLPWLADWLMSRQMIALKAACLAKNIPVHFSADFNSEEFLTILRDAQPDLVVIRVNQILKAEILAIPRLGTWCVHSSLLPSYQGIAAEFHGLRNGETMLGTSIFRVELELDKGPVIFQSAIRVRPGETVFVHMLRNNFAAGVLLCNAVRRLASGGPVLPIMNTLEKSYHSWPKPGQVSELRRRGHGLAFGWDALRYALFCLGFLPVLIADRALRDGGSDKLPLECEIASRERAA